MKNELIISRKIQVKKSPVEGYGVFATEDIKTGEVLEEVPFILMPKYTNLGRAFHDFSNSIGYCESKNKFYESLRQNLGFKDPEKYYFTWSPPQPNVTGEKISFQVLPLGLACIYNSSNTKNNAGWKVDRDTFTFYAISDIKAGEEIRTFYGYFVDDSFRNWNSDLVMYFGLDTAGSSVRLSSLKFQSAEMFEAKMREQGYHKIMSLLEKYKDLKIEKISAIAPSGQEGLENEKVGEIKTTREMYEILHGYKTSNADKIKLVFSNFVNDERDEVVIQR